MPSDLVKKLDRTVSALRAAKGLPPQNRAERQKHMAAMQKVLNRHNTVFPQDPTQMGAGSTAAKMIEEMRRVTREK